MALTIEIDHARTRAKKAAAAGTTTKVVPQSVKGRIRRLKWVILVLTLGIYYIAPFLRWDRGPGEPSQAILLDFEHGGRYGFFIEIWPQELYYVTGLMILAAAILILANALAGRVWCGFACPQTVWTDLFLLVERLIGGDRRDRLKKMNAPLTLRRVAEIGAKHSAWLLISFATGGALVFYFTDAPTLVHDLAHGQASLSAWTWITVFAGTTYGLAGFARVDRRVDSGGISSHFRGATKEREAPAKQTALSILFPDKANAALDRIEIPRDTVERISELLTPASSLIISDNGFSHETGKDTDFIVVTH